MTTDTTATNTEPTAGATIPQPTDMAKLTALFTEFGIGFKPNEHTANSIVCEKGDAKIGGYNGFSAQFDFDENGKFKEMSVWE